MDAPQEEGIPPTLSYSQLERPTLVTPLMRSGRYMVAAPGATLPPVCPICGKAANGKFLAVRVPVAESFSARRTLQAVELNISYCERHAQMRRIANVGTVLFMVGVIASLIGMIMVKVVWRHFEGDAAWVWVISCGLASVILSGICSVIATRGPRRFRAERDHALLTGVHSKLLAQLPSFPDGDSGTLRGNE